MSGFGGVVSGGGAGCQCPGEAEPRTHVTGWPRDRLDVTLAHPLFSFYEARAGDLMLFRRVKVL